MDSNDFPSTKQILGMMEEQLGNEGAPTVMRHAARVMPEMLAEHVRGKSLEAFKIARLVVASGAIANAEPLLVLLDRVES